MRTNIARIGFLLGAFTLVLHFSIYVSIYMDEGLTFVASFIRQYSYFTILTNLGLVLIFASASLPNNKHLKLFRTPEVRATGAGAIALVSLYYHFVLSSIWNPEGFAAYTDIILHYIMPAMYLLWFTLFNRTGTLLPKQVFGLLSPPILYLVYILVRGELVDEYPYPAFNIHILGWPQVLRNSAELLVFLSALCLVMIGIDRIKPNFSDQT